MEDIAPILEFGLRKCTHLHSFRLLISLCTLIGVKNTHSYERRMTTSSFLVGIELASFLSSDTSHFGLRIIVWERDIGREPIQFPADVWEAFRGKCGGIGLKSIVVQYDGFSCGLNSVQHYLQEIPELEEAARMGEEEAYICDYAQCRRFKRLPPLTESYPMWAYNVSTFQYNDLSTLPVSS